MISNYDNIITKEEVLETENCNVTLSTDENPKPHSSNKR